MKLPLQHSFLAQARRTPAVPGLIPRRTLRLGRRHHIAPVPDNFLVLCTIILSAYNTAGCRRPAIPDPIAGRALGFGDRDVEVAFPDSVGAGTFGELSSLEPVVVELRRLPAVAGVVVGGALGFGNGDDVVAFDCCGLC